MSLTNETAKFKALLVSDAITMSPRLPNKALNNNLPKLLPLRQLFDPLVIAFEMSLSVCVSLVEMS
jgi:hypothetical protein